MASQASIEDAAKLATIANTRAEVVKLQLYSNTSPYTLAALPAGMFRGQMLVMFTLANTNQTITIPNDAAKKILTASGSSIALTGTSCRSRSCGTAPMDADGQRVGPHALELTRVGVVHTPHVHRAAPTGWALRARRNH